MKIKDGDELVFVSFCNDNDYIENWYERDIFLSEFSEDGNIFCHSFQNGLVRQYEEDHSYSDETTIALIF